MYHATRLGRERRAAKRNPTRLPRLFPSPSVGWTCAKMRRRPWRNRSVGSCRPTRWRGGARFPQPAGSHLRKPGSGHRAQWMRSRWGQLSATVLFTPGRGRPGEVELLRQTSVDSQSRIGRTEPEEFLLAIECEQPTL